jgi:predicted Fe-Mo cluster-binding NifX family protein
MIIAITSTGNNLNAKVDKHFGRCAYFIIYDTKTKGLEFLPNPFRNMESDAGKSAIELIVSKGVTRIISGEMGIKIKPLLDLYKIQLIILGKNKKSISEIFKLLNH